MITIKDKALGPYEIIEDFKGFKVKVQEEKETLISLNTFEEALKFIAHRISLDSNTAFTLYEYIEARKNIFERIVEAQNPPYIEENSVSHVIEFTKEGPNE